MIALIQMIYSVAKALEELNNQAVFVGGATVPLYLPQELQRLSRPTEDVDIVLNLIPKVKLHRMESLLRSKNFKNDSSKGAPLCRWLYAGIQVDIVSPDRTMHGFTNSWYKEGVSHTIKKNVNEIEVNILSLPFFLATKLEAYDGRGQNDIISSHDIEDIISMIELIDENEIIGQIQQSPPQVKGFLADRFKALLQSDNILSAVQGNAIARNGTSTPKIIDTMTAISKIVY